jgi:hypothetical protein
MLSNFEINLINLAIGQIWMQRPINEHKNHC